MSYKTSVNKATPIVTDTTAGGSQSAAASLLTTIPGATQTGTVTPSAPPAPKVVYVPVTQNNSVVSVNTVQQSAQESGNGATIAIIVSVIVALTVGGGLGYYLYRRYGPKDVNFVDPHMTERERVHQTSRPEVSQMSPDEKLDDQYHPSAGFDIFG